MRHWTIWRHNTFCVCVHCGNEHYIFFIDIGGMEGFEEDMLYVSSTYQYCINCFEGL